MSHCNKDDSWSVVCKEDPQEGKREVGLRDKSGETSEKFGRKACRLPRQTVAANVL